MHLCFCPKPVNLAPFMVPELQETADVMASIPATANLQAVVSLAHSSAARQLGLHYLKRYFLLIVYR